MVMPNEMYEDYPSKLNAVMALCPNAQASWIGRQGEIVWHDTGGAKQPTDAEVEAKWTELKTAWQNKKYIRDRSGRTHEVTDNLYPYWGEQFDLLWHCIDADSELKTKFASFYNALKTVKDAHPKP